MTPIHGGIVRIYLRRGNLSQRFHRFPQMLAELLSTFRYRGSSVLHTGVASLCCKIDFSKRKKSGQLFLQKIFPQKDGAKAPVFFNLSSVG